jgi:DNA-binding MarR family transcriptional regulator
MPQSTVTDLVARAVAKGLITRKPSRTDARVTQLSLTADGRRRLRGTLSSLRGDRADVERSLVSATRLLHGADALAADDAMDARPAPQSDQ